MAIRRSYTTIMKVLCDIVINAFLLGGFVGLKFVTTQTWNSGVCIYGHTRSLRAKIECLVIELLNGSGHKREYLQNHKQKDGTP